MSWLSRNASSIEAAAALCTALVAVAALIGVKVQLDEADRMQKEQSAREAYRSHLALAATLPGFAEPGDACALLASDQAGSYAAFVDHLLYSAEQMLAVSEGWEPTFMAQLTSHEDYICSSEAPSGETEETAELLARFKAETCASTTSCPESLNSE